MAKRILIGKASVDSGLLLVTDPSYFIGRGNIGNQKHKSWKSFVATQKLTTSDATTQMSFVDGNDGLGVVVPLAGDGDYPVYAKLNKNNEPTEVIIKLK